MYSPKKILHWIYENVKGMRRSRQTTLGMIVSAAMRMKGVGVLALGRAMPAKTSAKHRIKRVWRFFRNKAVEVFCVQKALAEKLIPSRGRIIVLVDWTEMGRYKTLVMALPRDGRALPVWWKSIRKDGKEGRQIAVEAEGLCALERLLPKGRDVVIVGDRGFGNSRWLREIERRGWGYVQRYPSNRWVEGERCIGKLNELGIERGQKAKDFGEVLVTETNPIRTRLITTFAKKAKEPWYLVTNLKDIPAEIVRIYQRRMWIEEMFRDFKNRRWGLGLRGVELSEPERQDRLLSVLALAYVFLCAFGAAAETENIAETLKANTERSRVMTLARIGSYFIQITTLSIDVALIALNNLPP